MNEKGYTWFNTGDMTAFWKNELKSREKYGIYITKINGCGMKTGFQL